MPAARWTAAESIKKALGRQRAGVRSGTDIGGDYGPCRHLARAAAVRHEIGRQRLSSKRKQL
ncbi:MAG: hypothetical protein KBE14_12445, partial [Ottowia sp.]|nr:hypothetical protein [Ottowia sp.]